MASKEDEFVRFSQDLGEISGMDRPLSTLVALIYLEPQEISLEKLAEKSGYSLSAVSVKVNLLERLGFVTKSRQRSSRKIFVYMEKDMGKTMREMMLERQRRKFAFVREKLPGIIANYRKRAATEQEKKKLKIMEEYYRQMLQVHGILEKFSAMLGK